jgi:aspartate kinase
VSAVRVVKFGGSSFTELSDYRRVAEHLMSSVRATGGRVVAVVSGMPGETEALRERLSAVNPSASEAGTAGLLTLADVVSAQLLSEAVIAVGGSAVALPPHRNGIVTNRIWMWARIDRLDPSPVRDALAGHDIVVIPGGPAADDVGMPTWMGKNSSDLAAVATAAGLGLPECEIHSDVTGVYSADPRLVRDAEPLPVVSYDTAARLSALGAKVLHRRSVLLAKRLGVRIVCRGNRSPFESGTTITYSAPPVSSVVIDLKSDLIGFDDTETTQLAQAALADNGVHAIIPSDLDRSLLAVVGSYSTPTRYLDRAGIRYHSRPGRLVSLVEGTSVRSHVADSDDEAVRLGRALHSARRAADNHNRPELIKGIR